MLSGSVKDRLLLEIKAIVCVGLSDAYLDLSFFEISSSGFLSLSLCALFMFLTRVASHSWFPLSGHTVSPLYCLTSAHLFQPD